MQYRSIHYLRGLAALSVVAFHTGGSATFTAGVDVFFVISGFVMVHATRRDFDMGRFLRDRAARILPAWWAACLTCTLLVVEVPFRDYLLLAETGARGGTVYMEPVLSVGWTLHYEVMFYLILALAAADWRKASVMIVMLSGVGVVLPTALTNPILLEFAFGMALARLPKLHNPALLPLGIVACTLAPADPHDLARSLLTGIPAAMIVGGLLGMERRIPQVPVLGYLGTASYSIYLTHMIAAHFLGSGYLSFALSVAAGCVFNIAVETPLTRALGRHKPLVPA